MVGVEISQQALGSEQSFTRVYGEAKAFIPWPNTQWISAVRVFSSFIDNGGVPHYEQSVLGGKDFRGFPSGRFVDRGVFTVNLEERIWVIRLELLRVPFDVEAAPFVEFGQVFNDLEDIEARRLQVSYGLGIRGGGSAGRCGKDRHRSGRRRNKYPRRIGLPLLSLLETVMAARVERPERGRGRRGAAFP